MVQKIYSKKHIVSFVSTNDNVTELVNPGMVKIQKLADLENKT